MIKKKIDYLIIGAGFFGAVLAERIANVLGKNVFSKTISGNTKVESLNLRSGIYILKVSENGKSTSSKLIIE